MRTGWIFSRVTAVAVAATLLIAPLPKVGPSEARADGGLVTILKDGLYGGATGLLLGAVIALVVDSKHRDDSVRWGIVVGTFAGCAYGIYDVSHSEFSMRPNLGGDPLAEEVDPSHPKLVSGTPRRAELALPARAFATRGAPVALGARKTALGS